MQLLQIDVCANLCGDLQTSTKLYLVLDFINGGHLFFQLYRAVSTLRQAHVCLHRVLMYHCKLEIMSPDPQSMDAHALMHPRLCTALANHICMAGKIKCLILNADAQLSSD